MDSSPLTAPHADALDDTPPAEAAPAEPGDATVSTHVLVPDEDVRRLRALSARTRIAQSDFLREAVDDLLRKYGVEP